MQEYLIMKNETTKLKLLQFIIEKNQSNINEPKR